MKKLLFIVLAILFSVSALAAPPPFTTEGAYPTRDITAHGNFIMENNGIEGDIITGTTGNLILYVDPLGVDTGTCLAAGAGACLTIQSAIDRVPKYINHNVTIFVNSATYATAYIAGFVVRNNADFIIRGVLIDSITLATGTATGTATGGTTTTCIDAGQTWTVDDVIGKLVYLVGSGEYRMVYDNDGTTLYFNRPATTCNGQDYEIKDWTTFLAGVEPNGGLGPITVENNDTGQGFIKLSNLATIDGQNTGFNITSSNGVEIERCYSLNNTNAFLMTEVSDVMLVTECFASASTYGFQTARGSGRAQFTGNVSRACGKGYYFESSTGHMRQDYCVTISSTIAGTYLVGGFGHFFMNGCLSDTDGSGVIFGDYTATYDAASSATLYMYGGTDVSNATGAGIIVSHMSYLVLDAVTGTANGTYGVDARFGAQVLVNAATTITGATDDATANEGATDLTWAAEFAADGDIVVNLDSLARIERRD